MVHDREQHTLSFGNLFCDAFSFTKSTISIVMDTELRAVARDEQCEP